jgi:uncharacterized protein YcbX
MTQELGRIEALWRYPVKSMAGCALTEVRLGWHGLEGDRRHAFRRLAERGGFPWLTASKVPEMIRYQPIDAGDALPTHVRSPDGRELELAGDVLRDELAGRHGAALELMRMDQGVFDDARVSLIAVDTGRGLAEAAGRELDLRRFRANIVVRTARGLAFEEDGWLGKHIVFGEGADAAAISVTQKDPRCVMLNLDPDTAEADASVMKAAVRLNQNDAGVYASVLRTGRLAVGQPIYLVDPGF